MNFWLEKRILIDIDSNSRWFCIILFGKCSAMPSLFISVICGSLWYPKSSSLYFFVLCIRDYYIPKAYLNNFLLNFLMHWIDSTFSIIIMSQILVSSYKSYIPGLTYDWLTFFTHSDIFQCSNCFVDLLYCSSLFPQVDWAMQIGKIFCSFIHISFDPVSLHDPQCKSVNHHTQI